MKLLFMIFTTLGLTQPDSDKLTRGELRFVQNVIKIQGAPEEVYKLPNGKIQMDYSDTRITLGQDGFIHDLEILEGNEWIDLGPEY